MRDRKLAKETPIVEAVLEFRVKEFSGLTAEQIERFKRDFRESFPKAEELKTFTSEFSVSQTGIHSSARQSEPNALILKSDDEKDLIRIRLGSLVVIRLEPYDDWSQLVEPALAGLTWLIEKAGIRFVERIGARVVNRFPVPSEKLELEDWFKYVQDWPDDVDVTNFLAKYTAWQRESPLASTIVQTFRHGKSGPELILDIDTYTSFQDGLELRQDQELSEQLSELLSELRGIKNEMFYKHVTEQALERYR